MGGGVVSLYCDSSELSLSEECGFFLRTILQAIIIEWICVAAITAGFLLVLTSGGSE
jgi:hypothetical protein